jgi:hypothetical protein
MKAFIEDIDAENVSKVFERAYRHAQAAVQDGRYQVVIRRQVKSRDQEEKYHAMIGDIAEQWHYHGRKWTSEDMKRLLVDAFKHETLANPANYEGFDRLWRQVGELKLAPAIGRDGFVALGEQTRRFPSKLANAFISWLQAFGDEQGVVWTDPEWQSQMREMQRAA